jgi:hypothetical protein
VQTIPASLLNIINRKHVEKGLLVDEAAYDVQWQILMGKSRNREDLSLLSGAAAIFRVSSVCFLGFLLPFPTNTSSYYAENWVNLP